MIQIPVPLCTVSLLHLTSGVEEAAPSHVSVPCKGSQAGLGPKGQAGASHQLP